MTRFYCCRTRSRRKYCITKKRGKIEADILSSHVTTNQISILLYLQAKILQNAPPSLPNRTVLAMLRCFCDVSDSIRRRVLPPRVGVHPEPVPVGWSAAAHLLEGAPGARVVVQGQGAVRGGGRAAGGGQLVRGGGVCQEDGQGVGGRGGERWVKRIHTKSCFVLYSKIMLINLLVSQLLHNCGNLSF